MFANPFAIRYGRWLICEQELIILRKEIVRPEVERCRVELFLANSLLWLPLFRLPAQSGFAITWEFFYIVFVVIHWGSTKGCAVNPFHQKRQVARENFSICQIRA